ncbi:MAG: transposase [Nitrososphaeraceae archaeon]|nr:transposase [Nitrososphaeraceae archaeon]
MQLLAQEDEMAKLLMTVLGIGYYSALLIVSEVGDINRFPDSYRWTDTIKTQLSWDNLSW